MAWQRWVAQFVAVLLIGLCSAQASAQDGVANLNISPRRVIFTPTARTAAVYIFNQGATDVLVDVSLVDNVMLPSGEIVPVETVEERGSDFHAAVGRLNSAKELLLATPSRVSLPAGEGRTIRLRAVMPEGSAPQELRTHLTVTTVPSADTGLTAESAAELQNGELRFNVQTTFGISIPLIVRSGAVSATPRFGALELEEPSAIEQADGTQAVLLVPIERTGDKSLYGNVEIRAGSARNAPLVGLARGIGVYAEQDRRMVRVPLATRPASGETLTVTLTDEEAGTSKVLLTDSFIVP